MVIHSSFYLLFIHSHLLLFGCSVIAQSGLTLCDPMVYTVHGILQARILEWVAFSFSRGSSQPRDLAQVSHIAGGFFLYQLSHRGSQGILKWVVDPFSHRLSDPGFEPWFSVLQADSLPTELSEKHFTSISSVQFNHSVMSDSLWPQGLQYARLPCPSPTSRACSNSFPSRQWWNPTISSSVIPFSFAFNLSQHQGLFKWVHSSFKVAKVLEFQLQHQSFQWTFRTDFL